jgi:hypothetical protein
MAGEETPSMRYRRLAQESFEVANQFPQGESQVWQRLADQYTNSTPTFVQPNALEQPVVQQQQQVQPKDDDKS